MTSKGYQRLERKIERAEKRRGHSTARASNIAHAAAGKVARERRAKRRNASELRIGELFTWTSPEGKKRDFKVARTTIGVDTAHALVRDGEGRAYRVAKTPDGKRPFGRPERMGR